MFCYKCGAQAPDDAEFCPKCGTKLENDHTDSEAEVIPDITQQPMNQTTIPDSNDTNPSQTSSSRESGKKYLGKAVIIGAILVSMLAVFAIASVITQHEENDLDSSSYQENSKPEDSSDQSLPSDSKTDDSKDSGKEENSTETTVVEPVKANDFIYKHTGDAVTGYLNLNFRYLGDVMKLEPTSGTDITGDYYEGSPYEGYDGLALVYDENYFVSWAVASPEAILVNGRSLDKNRDELVKILGNPSDEEAFYDELEGEDRYTMQYILQDDVGDSYLIMFDLPSANDVAQSITFSVYDDGI